MAVDYDVVIVGATPAGIHAAIAAATLKARVALITQGVSPRQAPEWIPHQALLQRMRSWRVSRPNPSFPGEVPPFPTLSTTAWPQLMAWLDAVLHNVETLRDAAVLAYQGVDVVAGMGEFCRQPGLGVRVGDRWLQGRGYLLTMNAQSAVPAIAGLEQVGYLTAETLPQQWPTLIPGQQVAILGNGKTALELAQMVVRLGLGVTLLTPEPTFLPQADRAIVHVLQAQLEVEGVRFLPATAIDQIRRYDGRSQIFSDRPMLTVDQIILATGHVPNLETLNLAAAGVQWDQRGIRHTAKLQTTNPRIYACEGRIGADCWPQVAIAEAAIALHNILFWPSRTVDYMTLPLAVDTDPELAWIGSTEATAIATYGKKNVYCLSQSGHTSPAAQLRNDLTGLCQLIVQRNGRVLGAHLAGAQASEAIAVLTLAMQQKLNIGAIASLALPSSTLATLLPQTATQFRRRYLTRHHRQQDWLDHLFDLRRLWTKP